MLIILDKGHGNNDPGACGCGLIEADLTDNIGNLVANKLSNYNVDIKFAPRGSLKSRTDYANQIKCDYFLSIHINSATASATGFESHIYTSPSQKSIEYQKIIHSKVMNYLKQFNIVDRGLRRSNFHVLRETNCSSILLENLFISNPNDAKLLKDNNFLNGLSDAIVKGLVECFNLQLKQQNNNQSNNRKDLDKIIKDTKNSVNIIIGDKKVAIENYIIDDRIFLSARDICNILNKQIEWQADTRTVIIK